MRRYAAFLLPFAMAPALSLTMAPNAAADEIHLFNGKPKLDVIILGETFESISYRTTKIRQAQNVPADQVKEVVHETWPPKYQSGLELMGSLNYEGAALRFGAEAGNPSKKWVGQYARFNEAECYRALKKYDEALKAYEKLLKEDEKTRFYGDVFVKKMMCYQSKRDGGSAKKAMADLKAAVTSQGLPSRWNVVADYHVLRMEESKDAQKAFDAYMELQRRASREGVKDIANKARLRIGSVLVRQGKIDEARDYFNDIIDDRQASDMATVAGAFNGLGSTFVAKTDPSTEDWESALFAYGRAAFQYGEDLKAMGDSEMLPEALYWVARALEVRTDNAETNAKRARVLYTRVLKEYASSPWAEKAVERM